MSYLNSSSRNYENLTKNKNSIENVRKKVNILTKNNVNKIKAKCKEKMIAEKKNIKDSIPHNNTNDKPTRNTKAYRKCKNNHQGRTKLIGSIKTLETKQFLSGNTSHQPSQGGKKLKNTSVQKGGENIKESNLKEAISKITSITSNYRINRNYDYYIVLQKNNNIFVLLKINKIPKGTNQFKKNLTSTNTNTIYKKFKDNFNKLNQHKIQLINGNKTKTIEGLIDNVILKKDLDPSIIQYDILDHNFNKAQMKNTRINNTRSSASTNSSGSSGSSGSRLLTNFRFHIPRFPNFSKFSKLINWSDERNKNHN